LPGLALNHNPPDLYLLSKTRITGRNHQHLALHQPVLVMGFFKTGSQELFAQGWLLIVILLISASTVARITGVSHQHWKEWY
jgi:hypothetical protein